MTNYKQYEDIDVPSFMKNKAKSVKTKEVQNEEIEKAYIKGGLMGVATTFILLGMFALLAIIEML